MSNSLSTQFLINYYYTQIDDINSTIFDLRSTLIKNANSITNLVSSFNPTTAFSSILSDFESQAQNYIFQAEDKLFSPDSFVGGLREWIELCGYINSDEELLSALGLPVNPTDLSNLKLIASEFIDEFANSIFLGMLNNILANYNYNEFNIGLNYAVINTNIFGYSIPTLIAKLNQYINALQYCLPSSVDILSDVNTWYSNIMSNLSSVNINSSGFLDYSSISSLPTQSITDIQNTVFATKVVINNSLTNVAQIIGEKREDIELILDGIISV